MVTIIPARIQGGRIVSDEPLPEGTEGLRASIVLRRDDLAVPQPNGPSPLTRLRGLLKGGEIGDDPIRDYTDYLEAKYARGAGRRRATRRNALPGQRIKNE